MKGSKLRIFYFLFFGLATTSILCQPFSAAAAAYTASDVIGQSLSDGSVSFTRNSAHNSPNKIGFDGCGPDSSCNSPLPPSGIALDSMNHRLFISDNGNNRILVYGLTSADAISSHLPSYVIGQSSFDVRATGTSATTLFNPNAMAYDATNTRLFVSDSNNNRILMYDFSSGITNGMGASKVLGQINFSSNPAGISSSTLNTSGGIAGLAYDGANNRLFVTDQNNNRILMYDLSSGITNGMAASKVLGQADFVSLSPGTSSSTLRFSNTAPGLTYDVGNSRLFVADSNNSRILMYDLSSGITNGMGASRVLGQINFASSTPGISSSTLNFPMGLVYDGVQNRLFASDAHNLRILMYDLSSGITNGMGASRVLGQADFVSINQAEVPTSATINGGAGLVYDGVHSRLFVTDMGDNRVLIYDLSGGVSNNMNAVDVLGQQDAFQNPSFTKGGENDSPNARGFYFPNGILVDPVDHRLFLSDGNNFPRVIEYDLDDSNNLISYSASHVLGQADLTSLGYQGGSTSSSTINTPYGMSYDSDTHRLFVSDRDNNRILIYDLSNGITNGMGAVNVLGQTDLISGSPGFTVSSTVYNPNGVHYDAQNKRLFVIDNGDHRILIYDLSNGITNGMGAVNVLGQPNFASDTIRSTASSTIDIQFTTGIAYDSTRGRLFFMDESNNRILVFDLSNGITNGMGAAHVLGQIDFTSHTTGTSSSTLNNNSGPNGMSYDSINDRLFVADEQNQRVLAYDFSNGITDGMGATAVLGQVDFNSASIGTSNSALNYPQDVTYDDTNNRLYVLDFTNNRILIYNFVKISTASLSAGTVNSVYSASISSSNSQGSVSFSLDSGSLPSGLTLGSNGTLSGTPTQAGTFSITIKATDELGAIGYLSDKKTYNLTINNASGSSGGGILLNGPRGNGENSGGGGGGSSSIPPVTTPANNSSGGGVAVMPGTSGSGATLDIQTLLNQLISLVKLADSKGLPLSIELRTIAGLGNGVSGMGSGGGKYLFQHDLKFGMNNQEVQKLQLFLIQKNIGPASIALRNYGANGNFGNFTKKALIEYQTYKKIDPAVGFFGSVTRAAVNGE